MAPKYIQWLHMADIQKWKLWLLRSSLTEHRPLKCKGQRLANCSLRYLLSIQPTFCQINYCRTTFPPIWDLIYSQNTESTLPVNIHCKTSTCGNLVASYTIPLDSPVRFGIFLIFSCRSSYVLSNNVEDTRNFAEWNQRS